MKATMKRVNKFMGLVLMTALLLAIAGVQPVKAASYLEQSDKKNQNIVVAPGATTHVVIPVKAVSGVYAYLTAVSVIPDEASGFRIENVKVLDEAGREYNSAVNVDEHRSVRVEFDLITRDTARIGYHTLEVRGSGLIDDFRIGETINISDEVLLTVNTYTPYELAPVQLVVDKVSYDEMAVYPDGSFDIELTVKNEGEVNAVNAYLSMDFGSSGLIPDYSVDTMKIGALMSKESKTVKLPVKVLPNAEAGSVRITANLSCKDGDGISEYNFSRDMHLNIKAIENNVENPVIEMGTEDNYKQLIPGTSDIINITITNKGEALAENIKLYASEGLGAAIGITKAYTSEYIDAGSLRPGESRKVEIPVKIANSFVSGLYELSFSARYTDNEANEKAPVSMMMYVKGPEEPVKDDTVMNIVSINNVQQSPENPVAGQKLSVSFDITNKGNAPVNDVRICGQNLSSAGFEPVNSEPYQSIGTIEAGQTRRVTMTFMTGKRIAEGLGTLDIRYEYRNKNDEKFSEDVQLYILNIRNPYLEEKVEIGRPKLIINGFSTDKDILQAGDTFDFTFSLKNTHNIKAAKNIKLTLTQVEGIFAPSQGSNIFYIEEIKAGDSIENTINLKTRADAITGDYALSIIVDYEYDDMSELDLEKGGISEENVIKLRATENYRPVVENLTMDSWNPVRINEPADLSFAFFNMGKSTLGNVYVTVEGDFVLANNSSMSYVGAVPGYGQQWVTVSVVPLVEGEAQMKVIVHFEDSNGDEQIYSTDYSTFVQGEEIFDPGMYDDPYINEGMIPGMADGEVEEDIMPLWLFILTAVVGMLTVIAITYGICIKVKKNKLRRQYDEEDQSGFRIDE